MSDPSLLFDGTLELCDVGGRVSGLPYWFEAEGEGTSFGDPKPVEVAIASLIRDGAIVSTTGDENREPVFIITVKGANPDALDAGVQALQLATRKRTTLVWTPPGDGPRRVWDVETSNLLEANGFDDLALVTDNELAFRLRLVCQPYRRGVDLIIDDAGTPPSTGVVVYEADDDTGWSKWSTWTGLGGSQIGTDIDVDLLIFPDDGSSASIRAHAQSSGYGPSYLNNDQVTGLSIDTDTGGYLSLPIRTVFEGNPEGDGLRTLWMTTATGGEIEVSGYIATSRDAAGFVRYVWQVEAGLDVTGYRTLVKQTDPTGVGTADAYVWYGNVELAEAATTDHQIVKQHFVQGSARTTGSIQISAPSEDVALKKVMVITHPAAAMPPGFQPDGARWITQGTPTPDATALGGNYYTPNTSAYDASAGKPIFDPPVGMLTAGPYMMVSLAKVEGMPLVAGVQAQLLIDGTAVGPTSAAERSIPNIDTGWQFVPLGTVNLPPLPMQNADTSTKVRLLFKGAKIANVFMIPAWQVNGYPVADYSIIDCGDGTVEPGGASSSLFLDSPSVTQPQGAVWRGPTVDRSNAQSAFDPSDLKKPGTHFFLPGWLTNHVVSTGAAGPTSTLRYYDRYL